MAGINSINNASGSLTINPGTTGDSYIQFDINATGEFRMGVDDDDGDAFKLSLGSALGTNDSFVMNTDGIRTLPLQPAFLAYLSATQGSVTGDGTVYTIACNTEVFDVASDYDNTTFTFTAPITGKYGFGFTTSYQNNVTTGGLGFDMRISTSNSQFYCILGPTARRLTSFNGNNSNIRYSGFVFCEMDASDVATSITRGVSGGLTDSIVGDANEMYTNFYGYLAL